MTRFTVLTTALLSLLIASGTACEVSAPEPTQASGSSLPVFQLKRSTPEEQGVDSERLIESVRRIRDDDLDVRSLVLLRNDHIILELYVHPYDRDTLHNVKSVSKSVISALVGIALEEEVVESLDQAVGEFYPQYFTEGMDARKKTITLRHLLTMTAGLDLDENGPKMAKVFASNDWIRAAFEAPMAADTPMVESTPPPMEAEAPIAGMGARPPAAEGAPAETPVAEATKSETAPSAEKSGEPVAVAEEPPAAEPPAKMEPSPTAEAEPVKRATLKGEQWLLERPPGHITLQVLGGADREALAAFAEKHGLEEGGALFKGVNRGRTWYGLLSGVYPSLGAARDALKALPRLPAGYTPWTRSVASVQKEINKAK